MRTERNPIDDFNAIHQALQRNAPKQPTIIPEVSKNYAEQMGMQEGKDFIVNKCYTGA